jgi:hypothetical protein
MWMETVAPCVAALHKILLVLTETPSSCRPQGAVQRGIPWHLRSPPVAGTTGAMPQRMKNTMAAVRMRKVMAAAAVVVRVMAAWAGRLAIALTARRSRGPGPADASTRRRYVFGAIDRNAFEAAISGIRRRRARRRH